MVLTDNLISYWRLDETSGNAIDSYGGNDLDDQNACGNGTGKINGARHFNASNLNYMTHAANAALQTGNTDFALAYWVKFDTVGTIQVTISRFGTFSTMNEYLTAIDSDKFEFAVCQTNGNIDVVVANSFGTVTFGVWYFVVCQYDSVNQIAKICVNDGTVDTKASVGAPPASSIRFALGVLFTNLGADPLHYLDGLLDAIGFWKRLLTAAEITALYNGGAGLDFSFGVFTPRRIIQSQAVNAASTY